MQSVTISFPVLWAGVDCLTAGKHLLSVQFISSSSSQRSLGFAAVCENWLECGNGLPLGRSGFRSRTLEGAEETQEPSPTSVRLPPPRIIPTRLKNLRKRPHIRRPPVWNNCSHCQPLLSSTKKSGISCLLLFSKPAMYLKRNYLAGIKWSELSV